MAGAAFYVVMNFLAHGQVIGDAVSSCGLMIAFYYGLTGITSAWAYRHAAADGPRALWLRCMLPAVGGLTLVAAGLWSLRNDWNPDSSYTSWTVPLVDWHVGGVFLIGTGALLVGVVAMLARRRVAPAFFDQGLAPLDLTDPHPSAVHPL